MKVLHKWFLACVLCAFSFQLIAKDLLDQVAVIVDQGVILESEITDLVTEVKSSAQEEGQQLPSERAIRTQAIERLILESLQMQMAERMGIQISDPQLDQTINNMAQQQGATPEQFRQQIALEGLTYETYREQVRKQLVMGEVRRANVRRRIYITPQEVATLVELLEQQGAVQAEYRLGHILVGIPSGADDQEISESRERAERIIQLINEGSDFSRLAIGSSSGAEALNGGDMGWMNINSMPTLFAEAVDGKPKEELIGPIRSGAGFHILKIMDTRGIEIVEVEEVNARHILVKPSIILSDEKARDMLIDFRQKLIDGTADFAELAKEHSEDPGSALRGGELGYADPSIYVPEFRDTLALLKQDEYSMPVRSQHGWHLIQLIERRTMDATEKRKEDRASQLIFNRKFQEETDAWLRELRDKAYIEVLES
ncbi:MAG: peptidylprolyl isomerase SurA [Pseudomonadota bacterium]